MHRTATSLVQLAIDHSGGVTLDGPRVALKFMRNVEQYKREVDIRTREMFNERFVIPIITHYNGYASGDNVLFRNDAVEKGYGDYPYCVVMEAASSDLKQIVDRCNFAGKDWDEIKRMARQLATALVHVHDRGIVHGDLKREYRVLSLFLKMILFLCLLQH